MVGFSPVFGQFNETIVSDRPGQTNSPYTVGKMVLQLQTGPQFDGSNHDEINGRSFSFPAFIRFGITEKIELQTLWNYQSTKVMMTDFETTLAGLNGAHFGVRFNILEETDNAPAFGFEVLYNTKLRSGDFETAHASVGLNAMASKALSDRFSLNTNLGTRFDGEGIRLNIFYTLNLVYVVNDKLSAFFENYGNLNESTFDTYFDFGGAYLINTNLQLDLYGGFGYNYSTFSYLIAGGVSYRIVRWRKG
jgi:hypothetical protein